MSPARIVMRARCPGVLVAHVPDDFEVRLTIGRVDGDHRYLRVLDTGVGIASSDQARVFNEFERAADGTYRASDRDWQL